MEEKEKEGDIEDLLGEIRKRQLDQVDRLRELVAEFEEIITDIDEVLEKMRRTPVP